MNHQVWNNNINDEYFIINSKKIRIFPLLKISKDYEKLQIDNESFNFITIREMSNLITKIICKHLIQNKINPLQSIIVDSTSGVGGNTLSFLRNFKKVIAIEICQLRYGYLMNNVNIYNYNNVEFINDDFCNLYKNNENIYNSNVIFMDPPWGGIGYKNKSDLKLKLGDVSIENIIVDTFKLCDVNDNKTNLFVLKLPKNYDIEYFYEEINKEQFINKTKKNYLYILNKMILVVCEFNV